MWEVRTQGLNGQVVVDDTNTYTDKFGGMLVVADAVVATMSWSDYYEEDSSGDWSDLTEIKAGTYLPGEFDSITLTSGEVILYKR